MVNEAKQEVEDAWDWNCLQTRISVTTVAGQEEYSLTGSGDRFDLYDVYNYTHSYYIPGPYNSSFINAQEINPAAQGSTAYFDFSGLDSSGDSQIRLLPTPTADGVVYYFYGYKKQDYLATDGTSDTTSILVPWRPVVLGAYAKAVSERGESGGASFDECYQLYQKALADEISYDVAKYHKNTDWIPN